MRIPVDIDAMPQFFGRDLDEVAIMALIFVAGLLFEAVTLSLVIAWAVGRVYRTFRGGNQQNFLAHMLYWRGVYVPPAPSVIEPYVRTLS